MNNENEMKQRVSTIPIPQAKHQISPVSTQQGFAIQIHAKLRAAFALHSDGQLDKAEALYKEILLLQSNHFDALQLLATLSAQRENSILAVELFDQALKIDPNHAGTLNNRGNALRSLKRFEQALDSYDSSIKIKPHYADAHNNCGVVLNDMRHPERALNCFERAITIQPDYVEAHNNRGNILRDKKFFQQALECFDRALTICPCYAEALNSRGNLLRDMKYHESALNSFDRALIIQPNSEEVLNNRGIVLRELKYFEKALQSYNRVLSVNTHHADALNNRANTLLELKRFELAIDSFNQALVIKPHDAEVYNNRGYVLLDQRQHKLALESFDRSLTIQPKNAKVLNKRGIVLRELDFFESALDSIDRSLLLNPESEEALINRGNALLGFRHFNLALDSYEKALTINPDYAEAHWNEGWCRLLLGDFALGWRKCEWRSKTNPPISVASNFQQPLWLGKESIKNKTILLHSEQGLGDTIQFCRYASRVARLEAKVILEVQSSLKSLLKGLDGVSAVFAQGEILPDFDYHCPLMSLPLAFKTDISTITNTTYLKCDQHKVAKWAIRLNKRHKKRIGLVWSGNNMHKNDHNRSIPLDTFKNIINDHANYYCLQKELRAEDKVILARLHNITFLGDKLKDFSDAAALVELMDLVITVDTSMAHLAGAMGKEVWILLPFNPDWRWLLDRSDSPWYNSARLFRQSSIGDWEIVLSDVRTALDSFVIKT